MNDNNTTKPSSSERIKELKIDIHYGLLLQK